MKIQIKSIAGSILFEGDFSCIADAVKSAIKDHVSLCGADLRNVNLFGANLRNADLRNADLRGANLYCADLYNANLFGEKIKEVRCFSGLYRYHVMAILNNNGKRFVKMGCLFKSLEEWDRVGILESNTTEFPNDGSRKSQERAEAFEFAKNVALKLE